MREKQELDKYSHAQRSAEWFRLRLHAANSSAYETYFNTFGNRAEILEQTARAIINEQYESLNSTNYFMKFGTAFENIAGYIFSQITGVEYFETGSVPHKNYEFIRGSVDGYGRGTFDKAIGEEDFILETKSPVKRKPSANGPMQTKSGPMQTKSGSNHGYYCQIIQNIEIMDADVGIFNDVSLLPMTAEDISTDYAHSAEIVQQIKCEYQRFNLAANSNIELVACKSNEWYDDLIKTFGDLLNYTKRGERSNFLTPCSSTMFAEKLGEFTPISHFIDDGELTRQEWYRANTRPDILIMRPIAINIQRIERNQKYWLEELLPTAKKWVDDLSRTLTKLRSI